MKQKEKIFFKEYTEKYINHLHDSTLIFNKLIKIKENLIQVKKNKSKVLIFGNGGSAAIASHFSVDLVKNTNIRCLNFNEADILTCFSNDYGYEKWVSKAIDFYADKKDLIIFISSSGKSKNMLNGVSSAKRKKISKIITLTGGLKNNPLSKKGKINLWVNSKIYNHIENVHQFWLLSICDSIKLNKLK
jgi:D-sedoheptulose 7-phosphate isomerase